MYILSLIIPLFLFLLSGIMGRKLGIKGIYIVSTLGLLILLIINSILFYEVFWDNNPLTLNLVNWIELDIFKLNWILLFDDLSVTMLIVVNSVSLIVLLYSYDYMIQDPHLIRFFTYILLFVLCMIILITTSSLPILFIGWEGVGLSSFLLISFWFTRIETSLGGILAILMNRIGDIFFLLGILLSLLLFGSIDILTLISYPSFNQDILLLPFFLAAMAKSAQLSLHIWLPYSMEGPTPISALLHAATMVTAGVFLLLRLSLLISFSNYSIILISIIGGLTTFIGGTLALTSLDMKELIAYSTMSQLGYMITIMGLKYYNLSFFHLIFHAYFKALLFLTAGSIIHSIMDIQDLRLSGGLRKFLPISYCVSLIGITSLAGLPFTTGFYSKESIINSSFYSSEYLGQFIYLITIVTAFLTIGYSYRFLLTIYFNTTRLSLFLLKNLHYYSLNLTISLILISILTIFIGFFYSKFIYLYNLPIEFYNLNVPLFIKLLPILFFFLLFYIYLFFSNSSQINISFIQNQFFYKILYLTLAGTILSLSYRIFYKLFDYGFLDLLSPFTGYQLYSFSTIISNYLTPPYYFSLLLLSTYLFLFLL